MIKFTDNDVVNIDDAIWEGKYNPHNVRPWILHDQGFVICVVFASNLQDALDEAVNNDKLDAFKVEEEDYDEDIEYAHLGNAGEPFDIECISYEELDNPKLSLVKLYG